jgi:hypothetical protein
MGVSGGNEWEKMDKKMNHFFDLQLNKIEKKSGLCRLEPIMWYSQVVSSTSLLTSYTYLVPSIEMFILKKTN